MTSNQPLKRTPLYPLHSSLGGRMTTFAGYEMPIQFPTGIVKEHLATRTSASLFDVSHMGQIAVAPKSGRMADAAAALERLLPTDALTLPPGRMRYTVLPNDRGGIVDDLTFANLGDHFLLVVNAARRSVDEGILRASLADCTVAPMNDRALLALQGPQAQSVLARLGVDLADMVFMDARAAKVGDIPCLIARSGYTGEDGFEISVDAKNAERLASALLGDTAVAIAGLGARDTLRLEAGLCLYGADLDEDTTPAQARLGWTIPKARRQGGERAGGFPGADIVLDELIAGPRRVRVGLRTDQPTVIRHDATLFADRDGRKPIGRVTSGGFSPSLKASIAMAYVAAEATDGDIYASGRGQFVAMTRTNMPFIATHYRHPSRNSGGNDT